MSKLLDFLLKSIMAAILSIAAVVAGIITFPFLVLFRLYKLLKDLIK